MNQLNDLTPDQKEELIGLQTQLDNASSFLERMDLEDQLTDLKIKYKLVSTTSTDFEQLDCIGCGS